MNKSTLALALGADTGGDDEDLDLDAEGSEGETDDTEGGNDALADDLELAFDPSSDATTRAEAFRRAVKAAMK